MRTFLIALSVLIFTTAFTRAAGPTTNPAKVGTGSISGSAIKDGQPLAGISVRLMQRIAAPTNTGASDNSTPTTNPSNSANGNNANGDNANGASGGKRARRGNRAGAGGARPTFVAETHTDDSGKFTFANLAAGDYIVVVREPGSNIAGMSRATVSDNQTASVSIAAKERPAHGKKKGK